MAQYPPPERVGSGRSLSRCQHQPSLRFREKRLASQPPPSRRAQALKSPPNRVFYEFSLRARFASPRAREKYHINRSAQKGRAALGKASTWLLAGTYAKI